MYLPVFVSGEALKPGMNQLCSNLMRHLNAKGLYPVLEVSAMDEVTAYPFSCFYKNDLKNLIIPASSSAFTL
jgi:hypothetical protein